jgi:hypothetical protein
MAEQHKHLPTKACGHAPGPCICQVPYPTFPAAQSYLQPLAQPTPWPMAIQSAPLPVLTVCCAQPVCNCRPKAEAKPPEKSAERPKAWTPTLSEAVDAETRRRFIDLWKGVEARRSWVGLVAEADDILSGVMKRMKLDVDKPESPSCSFCFWRKPNGAPPLLIQLERLVKADLLSQAVRLLAKRAFSDATVGDSRAQARLDLVWMVIEQGIEHRAWADGGQLPGRIAPPPKPEPGAAVTLPPHIKSAIAAAPPVHQA